MGNKLIDIYVMICITIVMNDTLLTWIMCLFLCTWKKKFKSNDVNLQGLLLTRLKDIAVERHSLFYKNTTIASLDTRKTESEFLTEMAHHTKDLCQALITSTGNKLVLQKNIFFALWQKVPSCMWKFKLGTWLVYFFVCACL